MCPKLSLYFNSFHSISQLPERAQVSQAKAENVRGKGNLVSELQMHLRGFFLSIGVSVFHCQLSACIRFKKKSLFFL